MIIGISDVQQAARNIEAVAVKTPLLRSDFLDELLGGTVLLKPECLQRTGSFKIRGAYNFMTQLSSRQRSRGVVAWSSGNHAQGVAAAARLLGMHAAIVMPEDAPQSKIDNTRRLGGELVLYDRYTGDREAIARALARERGAVVVPSYDHADIIAGQGTVGLEIAEQAIAAATPPDQVLICCGGGGLSAGSATAIKELLPDTAVYTVEPEQFDDTARSLATGKRQNNPASARSICDALQAATPGALTFPVNQALLCGGLLVSDAEVEHAMRVAWQHLKLVVEPGGAVALAALLSGKIAARDLTTAVVISGGNVDAPLFARIIGTQSDLAADQ